MKLFLTICILLNWVLICDSQTVQLLLTNLTGKISYSVNSPLDQYQWRINSNTPSSKNVQIVFYLMNVQQAELRIYESQGNILLYSCVSCGTLLPPPFFSKTGNIIVNIAGTSGVSFTASQFALQYVCTPLSFSTSMKAVSLNLNMAYAKLSPLAVNGALQADSTQQWAIKQTAGTTIMFSFANFSFGSSCNARLTVYDQITIGSGTNIIFSGCKFSDAPLRWFYSYTGFALVVLTVAANGLAVTDVDFVLSYYANSDLYNCGSFLQPDVLTDASMILTDGSAVSKLMRSSTLCTWRIAPLDGATVSLILTWVSLKFGSSVVIYDAAVASGTVLWYGTGATATVPPVIYSSSSALYVVYQSDSSNSVSYFGFAGSYYSNSMRSVGSGSGSTLLAMSSAIDIHPPGNAVSYAPGLSYTWNVVPKSISGTITFSFGELRLLDAGDSLTLFDGPTAASRILGVFSGTSTPTQWYKTSGAAATLKFQSFATNSSALLTGGGNFRVSYYADGPNYHCGFSTNPASMTANSMVFTDGSSSVESMYSSQLCQWNVAPREAPLAVYIFFGRFSTSGATLSIYRDSVASGVVYTTLTDVSAVPAPILVPFASIGLAFQSKSSVSGYGFSLTYFGVANPFSVGGASLARSFPGDGVIRLYCSSMLSLVLALAGSVTGSRSSTAVAPNTNLTWLIAPSASSGALYLAFTSVSLPDCSRGRLDVYDGLTLSSKLVRSLCGENATIAPYKWLQMSITQTALLNFVSSGSETTQANFEMSFFSDGPNFHCGFAVNPASVTAPSMVLTDGSSSVESMYSGQYCEWLVQPQVAGAQQVNVVLEFQQCDLVGGELSVYAGSSASGELLWNCNGCNYVPRAIVSSTSTLFVTFSTASSSPVFGQGFQAVYWTVNSTTWREEGEKGAGVSDGLAGQVLELPQHFTMTADVADNRTAVFDILSSETPSSLQFSPWYSATSDGTLSFDALTMDGRQTQIFPFQSLTAANYMCGVVSGGATSALSTLRQEGFVRYASTQQADRFVKTTQDYKSIVQLTGISTPFDATGLSTLDGTFQSPSICKYHLSSGTSSRQAIVVQLRSLSFSHATTTGRLRIYGGTLGNDALLYDSDLFSRTQRDQRVNVTAPCGRCTIVLETNSTSSSVLVDYAMDLSFFALQTDVGDALCAAYIKSLLPVPKKTDPFIPVYIGAACAVFLVSVCIGMYYASKRQTRYGYIFYPDLQSSKSKKYVRVTPNHPRYSKTWDTFRNKFLPKGYCCVCKSITSNVFYLRCTHAVCVEDLTGYLEAALGDISSFPVKCPMHFEGCTGVVGAKVSKRILSEPQYTRFLEFSDRAVYGDGMRCIFCNNFVNFPDNMANISRVECPYCVQLFCVRCKKPWHFGAKCHLDKVDDSLEQWTALSGAMKCPACRKIIEKDDPETCHHMCHKITDGIPCVRDRVDFCYLCGEEVQPNYPHDEVRNAGVNHFPQGVFQKCRTVILREKEEEREKLKRIRRMKAKSPIKMATIVPVDSDIWAARGSPVTTTRNRPTTLVANESTRPSTPLVVASAQMVIRTDSPAATVVLALEDRYDSQWDRAMQEGGGDASSLNGRSFQRHRVNT